MPSADLVLAVCLGYVALLFALAFSVDRRARRAASAGCGRRVVYTLSISIYCTSWTFYGAVGSAARNGLEFVTIYLGPTLVFVGWWWLLRKLVRIGRAHRITSIADLISSRYGKSPGLAVLVTVIAVIATTPYIALQLQSVTRSFQAHRRRAPTARSPPSGSRPGWRSSPSCSAPATSTPTSAITASSPRSPSRRSSSWWRWSPSASSSSGAWPAAPARSSRGVPPRCSAAAATCFGPRWVALTFLSATAIICLPRQFQVTVVENVDERHLATASWLFPLYLFLISLFVLPIAIGGAELPAGGLQPRPVRADPAAVATSATAGAARLPRRLLLGDLDGDRRGDRALDHGLEPPRHAGRAALRCRAGSSPGDVRAAAAGDAADLASPPSCCSASCISG